MHGNDCYLDGSLNIPDHPEHTVELTLHALEIGLQTTCVASQETRNEDRVKGNFVRAAYALQERQFDASGQWVSVDSVLQCPSAYTTVRTCVR
jgi:hypothetical protein